MKIAVNARLLLPGKLEGTGWCMAETLKRITRAHPEHQFLFLFDRPYHEEFIFSDNITPLVVPPQARHPLLWHIWFEYMLPRELEKARVDFFLSPDGYLSLSSDVPSLPVIHDINFMHNPDFHPWLTGKYFRHYFPRFAAKATRIATVSDYSGNDISHTFGIPHERIDVVYNGSNPAFSPLTEGERIAVINELTDGNEYFLYVGSFHKRKNICGLLDAFDKFRSMSGKKVKMVLAGERTYPYPEMDRILARMRFRDDLIFVGRMEPPELRRLYGGALAFVYIPFFEGFGIPVLEAMNCDTPVLVSNRTSLPEVAGDAALFTDPYSPNSVVEGMLKIASDENCRNMLVRRARERRKLFSWERTAQLTWTSVLNAFADAKL
jgi:glycosyltransferase involved in cell wall biosynthesis